MNSCYWKTRTGWRNRIQNQPPRDLLRLVSALRPEHKRAYCYFIVFLICLPAFSRETVYLKSGFSLEAESHTEANDSLIFRVGEGTVEFPVRDISHIEPIAEDIAPATNLPSKARPEHTGLNTLDILQFAAIDAGVDQNFMRSIAKVESGLNVRALSSKGAIGLMQLMPGTAKDLGVDPSEPWANAHGGANYLRALLTRYNGNAALALAAYNAGPAAVEKFGGVPPYPETRRYILRVIQEYRKTQPQIAHRGVSTFDPYSEHAR